MHGHVHTLISTTLIMIGLILLSDLNIALVKVTLVCLVLDEFLGLSAYSVTR